MRTGLPFFLKALGTLYLLEAPLLLVMRAIVLMFVPSKSDWSDVFQGFQYRTWSAVLLSTAVLFFASGVACWVIGVRLGRGRPNAESAWRYLAGLLTVLQLVWLAWAYATSDRFVLFHLFQTLFVVSLGLFSWVMRPRSTPPIEQGNPPRSKRAHLGGKHLRE
jgi:hypothetical protein